jgi:hypothetical protein
VLAEALEEHFVPQQRDPFWPLNFDSDPCLVISRTMTYPNMLPIGYQFSICPIIGIVWPPGLVH